MTNTFYIAEYENTGKPWYQLLVRDTHFCISCGSDLDKILTVLKDYVKTYRTKDKLLRILSGLECQGKVSPATFSQREDYYLAHGEDYADLVDRVVHESMREAREEDKANSPLKKTKARLKKAGCNKSTEKTIEVTPKEDSSPAQESRTILRKPKVFKRHK